MVKTKKTRRTWYTFWIGTEDYFEDIPEIVEFFTKTD